MRKSLTKDWFYSIICPVKSETDRTDAIEIGHGYMVSLDGRTPIGYLHFYDISKEDFLELRYAIHPDYRGKKYGENLLKEATNYALLQFKNVKGIEFFIHPENFRSRKCALSANYIPDRSNQNRYIKQR